MLRLLPGNTLTIYMETTNMNDTSNNIVTTTLQSAATNLSLPLQSAVFIPMVEAGKSRKLSVGNRWCKLIKKGDNSKLPESLAVEVPAALNVSECLTHSVLADAVAEYLATLQDAQIKAMAIAGIKTVQYSELTAANLAQFVATSDDSGRIGQLSNERITNWFEAEARDNLIVALAERLGISKTATDAEVKRLEQIANQTRDNLAKLSSKKPVHFDARVLAALNWALDVTVAGDISGLNARLRDKLNMPVADSLDLGAALGF